MEDRNHYNSIRISEALLNAIADGDEEAKLIQAAWKIHLRTISMPRLDLNNLIEQGWETVIHNEKE